MKNCQRLINKEEGFVLVIAMVMLVILSLLGTFALNTTTFELQIAGNDRIREQNFYVAESAWKPGFQWLDNMAAPPDRVNTSITDNTDDAYSIVRNFGNGADGVDNADFSAGTEDGSLSSIPYWYQLKNMGKGKSPGNGKGFQKFQYLIVSNANGEQEVEVMVEKVFKVGY